MLPRIGAECQTDLLRLQNGMLRHVSRLRVRVDTVHSYVAKRGHLIGCAQFSGLYHFFYSI